MKKFLIFVLIIATMLAFASCGTDEPYRYSIKADGFDSDNPSNRSVVFGITSITTLPTYNDVKPRIGNVFLQITVHIENIKTENAADAKIVDSTFKLRKRESVKKYGNIHSNTELKNKDEIKCTVPIGESTDITLIFSVNQEALLMNECFLECDLTAMPGGNCYLPINERDAS